MTSSQTPRPSLDSFSSEARATRVLVAEDQADVQDALKLLLKAAGYSVDTASTPDLVLQKLQTGHYDLILMDLNYRRDTTSGAEGLQILENLRAFPSSPPVIVMTAWGSIDLAVQAMHLGARDFIQKPWDNQHLLHIAEKHIATHRAESLRRFKQNHELDEAIAVQRRLLPEALPVVPGLDIAGKCRPAGAVAGDYFDVLQLGNHLGLCIGDVIGKGLAAAITMSNLQAAVKVTAADWLKPSELSQRVNALACRNGSVDRFISFFYATYNPETRKLTYTNAGHNPPFLFRANGECLRLDGPDLVLGQIADWQFHDSELSLESGDRLLFYTDGVTEAGEQDGEEFGEERVRAFFEQTDGTNATELLTGLLSAVSTHCHDHFADDATCLVVSVH